MSMFKRRLTSGVLQPFFAIASSAALLAGAPAGLAQSGSSSISVASAAAGPASSRLGITLGGEAWVDGGPLRKNLVVDNPGFEAADYRAVLRCAAATADGCRVSDASAGEPAGFWNGAHYQVMSGRAAEATGTVVSHSAGEGGSILALDRNLKLAAGDYLLVEVLRPMSGVAGWYSSSSGGGAITAETADLSPETPGKQALLLSALGRGGSVRLSQEVDGQPGRSKLQLNGAYELSFRAKGAGGNNQLNVSVARMAGGDAPYLNRSVALTGSWAQYTLSFSAAEVGAQSSPLRLSFAASGANIELDDVSLQQSNSSATNATEFRDEVVNGLQDLHPGTIRMLSGGSDVLAQMASPFARHSQGMSSDAAPAPGTAYGIQEFLQLCATVGADAWITVPAATTPTEMKDLIQYLTGNGSDVWSSLRIARGHAEPWTSAFSKVHIELEDTTGISGSAGEHMASPAYASWSAAVFGAARRTTGYSAGKFDLILTGSSPVPPVLSTHDSSLAAETSSTEAAASSAQVFNCSSGFASSGACGVSLIGWGGEAFAILGSGTGSAAPPSLSGSQVLLSPRGNQHSAFSLNYQTPVNVQAFTSTFTFVPNGWNIAWVVQNNTVGINAPNFYAGAGCEGGFFQAFNTGNIPPNNIFALDLDSNNQINDSGGGFPYSTAQVYQQAQNPCNGTNNDPYYWSTTKLSTSPVPLTSPVNSGGSTTGDTYSATVTYDGTTFTVNMYDITAGGSCPGATCFSQSWSAVNIPSLVGANTAYVGLTTSTNAPSPGTPYPLYVDSFEYTVNSAPSSPSLNTYSTSSAAGATAYAANPSFSPVAGAYSGPQNVTLSSSTPGSYICYTLATAIPSVLPTPDNKGGCSNGTRYSGAIPVSSSETLYAIAGTSRTGLPSNLMVAAYVIGAAQAATPAFSPIPGAYMSAQTVTLSDSTSGATIYYTTDGATPTTSSTKYSGGIAVSSTETLRAIAVASGYNTSSVASAAYTINSVNGTPATPAFSVAAGTYASAQAVSISDATSGATIYYTTNGTTPTTSSTKYSGAITVSSTETLEAIATTGDPAMSAVASASYVIESATIDFPRGGFKTSSLDLNGGATITTGGLLELTDGGFYEARSAWFATKMPVQTFTTDFTFQQLNANADGITFTVQGVGPTTVGSFGISLGYGGMANSVAVKFDLYNNDGEGIDSTGLYTDGAQPTVPSVDLSSTPINLHSGDVMDAHMVYDGTNLTMTLTDTATGGSVTEVFPVNIPSLVGGDTAYVGFTGGTGGEASTQNVLSWTYAAGGNAPATPTFSVAAGTYASAQTVSISDATSGAAIYYTTNGTTPTTSSTKYSGAITVSSTETLKAVAAIAGPTLSAVASASYVIESATIDYPSGGFKASSLELNGGATITSNGFLQLTDGNFNEARSAWFATKMPVQAFTTDFTFEQLNANADGFTFTIQGVRPTALGNDGGALGYQGIGNSVAVKFDLYNNDGEGIDSTGLYTDGAQPTVPSVDLSSTPINLHSGDVMDAHMVYDGANLTMTLTDTATGGSVTEVFPVNIPSLVGGDTAYVGFTGGTGGEASTQNVLSWTFSTP